MFKFYALRHVTSQLNISLWSFFSTVSELSLIFAYISAMLCIPKRNFNSFFNFIGKKVEEKWRKSL